MAKAQCRQQTQVAFAHSNGEAYQEREHQGRIEVRGLIFAYRTVPSHICASHLLRVAGHSFDKLAASFDKLAGRALVMFCFILGAGTSGGVYSM
jgi:hypothetical protein